MIKNKRILQILPRLNVGGVERGTQEIAKALTCSGNEAHVMSSGGMLVEELSANGALHVKLNVHSKNPFTIIKNAFKIADYVRTNKIDLMHVRSRAPAHSVRIASKISGVPYISTFHGAYGCANIFKKWYNSAMLKGLHVIAISEYIKSHIEQNYKNYPPIHVVPRGVDLEYFNPLHVNEKTKQNLKNELKIKDEKVITLAGRFTRLKGQDELIKALHVIKNENFVCLLVGDNEKQSRYKSELMGLIKDSDLEQKVRTVPHVKNINEFYGVSDIVVSANPHKPEAFGRSIVEAMAMECLVIASNHGGASEIISANNGGFLVAPRDTQALASMLLHVINIKKDEKNQIMQNAQKTAHLYTKDKMIKSTLSVYERALSKS